MWKSKTILLHRFPRYFLFSSSIPFSSSFVSFSSSRYYQHLSLSTENVVKNKLQHQLQQSSTEQQQQQSPLPQQHNEQNEGMQKMADSTSSQLSSGISGSSFRDSVSEDILLGIKEAAAYLQTGEIEKGLKACVQWKLSPQQVITSPQAFTHKQQMIDVAIKNGFFSLAVKCSKMFNLAPDYEAIAKNLVLVLQEKIPQLNHTPNEKDVLLALELLMTATQFPLHQKTTVFREAIKHMSPAFTKALLFSQTRRFLFEYLDKQGWTHLTKTVCMILVPHGSLNLPSQPLPCPQEPAFPPSLTPTALPLFSVFKKAPFTSRRFLCQFLLFNKETSLAYVASSDLQLSTYLPLLRIDDKKKIDVLFVDNDKTLREAEKYLKETDIVGVDSEFFPHNSPQAVILQVATRTAAMVFDLTFAPCLPVLAALFRNPNIAKIGQAFEGDMHILRQRSADFDRCEPLIDTSTLIYLCFPNLAANLPIGLARLSAMFLGRRLCKQEQMSNWSRRPLTTSQLHYAALDAYILISLLDAFRAHPAFPQGLTLEELSQHSKKPVKVKPSTLQESVPIT